MTSQPSLFDTTRPRPEVGHQADSNLQAGTATDEPSSSEAPLWAESCPRCHLELLPWETTCQEPGCTGGGE